MIRYQGHKNKEVLGSLESYARIYVGVNGLDQGKVLLQILIPSELSQLIKLFAVGLVKFKTPFLKIEKLLLSRKL